MAPTPRRGHRTEDAWGEGGFRDRRERKNSRTPAAPWSRDPPSASPPGVRDKLPRKNRATSRAIPGWSARPAPAHVRTHEGGATMNAMSPKPHPIPSDATLDPRWNAVLTRDATQD